jgi:hypothetical protein
MGSPDLPEPAAERPQNSCTYCSWALYSPSVTPRYARRVSAKQRHGVGILQRHDKHDVIVRVTQIHRQTLYRQPWTRQTLDMTNPGQNKTGGTLGKEHWDFLKQWISVNNFADFSWVLLTYSTTFFKKRSRLSGGRSRGLLITSPLQ